MVSRCLFSRTFPEQAAEDDRVRPHLPGPKFRNGSGGEGRSSPSEGLQLRVWSARIETELTALRWRHPARGNTERDTGNLSDTMDGPATPARRAEHKLPAAASYWPDGNANNFGRDVATAAQAEVL
jgi:hypothetical protein